MVHVREHRRRTPSGGTTDVSEHERKARDVPNQIILKRAKMKRIPADKLPEGWHLAREVKDNRGAILRQIYESTEEVPSSEVTPSVAIETQKLSNYEVKYSLKKGGSITKSKDTLREAHSLALEWMKNPPYGG